MPDRRFDSTERRRLSRGTIDEPSRSELVSSIVGSYREMPGLCLRLNQAARLFGIRLVTCRLVLEELVLAGCLGKTRDGRYITQRLSDLPRPRQRREDTSAAPPRRGGGIPAVIGMAGGLAGALAMNLFARAVNAARHDREGSAAAPGRDRFGRGMQPPQAHGRADEDATVQVGRLAYRTLTGAEAPPETRRWLGAAAHYGLGAALGAGYGVLAGRTPTVRAGFGTLYGSLVWLIADEGVVPALQLSKGPRALSPGLHAYALIGHWVFGAALESVRRISDRLLNASFVRRASPA